MARAVPFPRGGGSTGDPGGPAAIPPLHTRSDTGRSLGPGQLVDGRPELGSAQVRAKAEHPGPEPLRVAAVVLELGRGDVDASHGCTRYHGRAAYASARSSAAKSRSVSRSVTCRWGLTRIDEPRIAT